MVILEIDPPYLVTLIVVSRADTIGAFNTGFDRVNQHRPTAVEARLSDGKRGLARPGCSAASRSKT